MKKKAYLQPETDVVVLSARNVLLAGSGETLGVFDDEETDEVLAPPFQPDLMPDMPGMPSLPGIFK